MPLIDRLQEATVDAERGTSVLDLVSRRDLLVTTAAVAAAFHTADMLGPNGSWGPFLWEHETPPVPPAPDVNLSPIHFEGGLKGNLSLSLTIAPLEPSVVPRRSNEVITV